MTFAPPTILDVRRLLKGEDADLDDAELGIVGGPSHIEAGTSYHLGEDQLKMWKNPYSARTSRDLAGLSNAASALDVDDDLDELRQLSVWMVEQCRAGAPDTLDFREIIYSPDGVTVLRWDRERGQNSEPVPDSDLSHRTHTHFAWYRDSEFRDKRPPFARFFGGNMALTSQQAAQLENADLHGWAVRTGESPQTHPGGQLDQWVQNGNPLHDKLDLIVETVAQLSTGGVDVQALADALAPLLEPMMRSVVRQELDATSWGSVV